MGKVVCWNVCAGISFGVDLIPLYLSLQKNGSFCLNNTSDLLALTSDEERQSRTRNYYNSLGYESVALVPLKAGDERIGLIQLNDKIQPQVIKLAQSE